MQGGQANVELVVSCHNFFVNTIHTWRQKIRLTGYKSPLPYDEPSIIQEIDVILTIINTKNDRLKQIGTEKELQISIMEKVNESENPRSRQSDDRDSLD